MAHSLPTARKLAVVTGTTSGVGLAVARLLLERGWHVLGAARRPSAIEHDGYEHVRVDLSDIDSLGTELASRLTALLGSRTLARVGLVNNAADPGLLGPVAALDPRRLAHVFAI